MKESIGQNDGSVGRPLSKNYERTVRHIFTDLVDSIAKTRVAEKWDVSESQLYKVLSSERRILIDKLEDVFECARAGGAPRKYAIEFLRRLGSYVDVKINTCELLAQLHNGEDHSPLCDGCGQSLEMQGVLAGQLTYQCVNKKCLGLGKGFNNGKKSKE